MKRLLFTLLVSVLFWAGSMAPGYAYSSYDFSHFSSTGSCVQCDLSGADLEDLYLSGVTLDATDLENANLRNTDLSGAFLEEANLRGADLEGANLSDAYLCHTTMPDGTINNSSC